MTAPSHRSRRPAHSVFSWLVVGLVAVLLVAVGSIGGALVKDSGFGGVTGLRQAIAGIERTTQSAQSTGGSDAQSPSESDGEWSGGQLGQQSDGGPSWLGGDAQARGQDTVSQDQATAATTAQSTGVVVVEAQESEDNAVAAGTGMVLTSSGLVLTNNHVVEDSDAIRVTIPATGRTYTAIIVGTDATDDVAVLRLADASGLKTVTIDNDDDLATGDTVTGVGNAGGTGTLLAASGTVTALEQHVTTQAERGTPSESLSGLIQTDAAIQAGDSGGPLLDADGEVVGMDTAASASGQSVGYAIPITTVVSIARQIVSQAGGTLSLAA